MISSLLDILKEEDKLIKEQEDVKSRIVSLLYTIDDAEMQPKYYQHVNIDQYKKEVEVLRKREEELDAEIENKRKSIIRYLLSEIKC